MLQHFYTLNSTASSIDFAFWLITAIVTFFAVFNGALTFYFLWRFNAKRNPKPRIDLEGNIPLEVFWTLVPTVLVFVFFWYGYVAFKGVRDFPEDSLYVKVTGRMWSWTFEYPNGEVTTELIVPVGKPVVLEVTSADVIHSFYVPAFRNKIDAIPGMKTYMWFTAPELGDYDVLCAEYCGLRHAYMLTKVVAKTEEEFKQEVFAGPAPAVASAGETSGATVALAATAPAAPSEADLAKKGEKLTKVKACVSCHSTDGSRLVGPSFKGLWASKHLVTTADGGEHEVTVDDAYVARAIKEPNAEVVKGYPAAMTPQTLSDDDITAVIAYLKSIQ